MFSKFQFYFCNIIKSIIIIVVILYGYLYFTRPELEISAQDFLNVVKNHGYSVYKTRVDNQYRSVSSAYSATKNKVVINYIKFNDENECKKYYSNLTDGQDTHYARKVSSDVRLGDIPAVKQSYVYEDMYYISIRTRHDVVFSSIYSESKQELNEVFDALYKVPNINFEEFLSKANIKL